MKIIVSHPTGNANVRAVARELANAGMLTEFVTSIATFPGSLLERLSHLKPFSELQRRSFDPLLSSATKMFPAKEVGRLLAKKAGLNGLTAHEKGIFSTDAVYRDLDHRVMKRLRSGRLKGLDAVYAYEDGALQTFQEAKKLGLKCIYDLPIAYWQTLRNLLQEEAERMPAWKTTLGGGVKDSNEKLDRKTRELELADVVIGPGQFVIDSLPQWAGHKKVIMSAFGSPEKKITPISAKEDHTTSQRERPLRILFVGSMSQRKGLGDLMEGMRLVKSKKVELVVMGSLLDSMHFYKSQFPTFIYEPGRSHEQVLKLMRTCDVLCLPSIVEGRALVMQEAMSQGLPLIITPNTGGADLIKEGETGFLVPIRSPERIAEKIDWFASNRNRIGEMGLAAIEHASEYTWRKYALTILRELTAFFDEASFGEKSTLQTYNL